MDSITRIYQNVFKGVLVLVLFTIFDSCNVQEPYKNYKLDFDVRVDDLVSRMTLAEKVSMLNYESPAIEHLGIPEYNWWNECLHGVGRAGIATVYPQAIAMAAMWDSDEMFNIAGIISDEARAKHHQAIKQGKRGIYQGLTFWTPNINIFRDPRWGRGMETYGEDPYLSGELGVAFIKGLQGDDDKYLKLVATAKHFVVHSGPEGLRHSFNAEPEAYDFYDTYTPHFKKAIQKGHVYSVMCAYNRYNGLPCCGNKELENLLRSQWGFEGYIVSDCWAIQDFYSKGAHEVVNTKAEAAAMAVQAGTDLNCGNSSPGLLEAVERGYISEPEIDVVLKRLLLARMKLGMFDPDTEVPYASIPYSVVDSESHKESALEVARKSMVLLKNDERTLPFAKDIKNIAVIGPNANQEDVLLGNYNGYPSDPITPLQGIRAKVPQINVTYAQGCKLADELPLLEPVSSNVLYTSETLTNHGLMAEYFNNKELKGKPSISQIDENIDFKWWNKGPGSGVNADTFSVRWSGYLVPEISGQYAIGGEGFSGFTLWIDGKEIISWDGEHHSNKLYEFIEFEAGRSYAIKVEYVQNKTEYAHMHLLWDTPDVHLIDEAVEIGKQSDAIVLCMGLSPMLEGEEMKVKVEGFDMGDRVDIQLPAAQQKLIRKIQQLGKPTVLVLLNGSALALNWEAENVPAILEAWYPGQAGGQAIADILFGDYNPAGRLPVTFYQSVDQLPDFKDYSMEGRTYRYFKGKPLYPFGHGLSYTTFTYNDLILPESITAGEPVNVSVEVVNTGDLAGDEVVQLYLWHQLKDYKTAIRSLKGFKRIHLKPGEKQSVNFTIQPEDMAVLDDKCNLVIVDELLHFSVGGCQPDDVALAKNKVIVGHTRVTLLDEDIYQVSQ